MIQDHHSYSSAIRAMAGYRFAVLLFTHITMEIDLSLDQELADRSFASHTSSLLS